MKHKHEWKLDMPANPSIADWMACDLLKRRCACGERRQWWQGAWRKVVRAEPLREAEVNA